MDNNYSHKMETKMTQRKKLPFQIAEKAVSRIKKVLIDYIKTDPEHAANNWLNETERSRYVHERSWNCIFDFAEQGINADSILTVAHFTNTNPKALSMRQENSSVEFEIEYGDDGLPF